MFRLVYFAVVLVCAVGGSRFFPGSLVLAAQQEPQEGQKPPAQSAVTDATAAPAADGPPAKPANRAKRVITNDDIKPSPYAGFGGLFYTSAGSINDCNASCFDQVRQFAQPGAGEVPNWREAVLRQLDLVRSNGEWQAYLHELYDAHNRICQLTFDQGDELRRSGNTRNLGPQEIAITEKYDAQMKAAQADLSAVVARQSAVQRIFADKPYANSFATVQGTRMQGGFCSQARVIYLP
ncbi:MAG: hypothetical protein ABSG16_08645 [Candidatus Acidiferrum sp.]